MSAVHTTFEFAKIMHAGHDLLADVAALVEINGVPEPRLEGVVVLAQLGAFVAGVGSVLGSVTDPRLESWKVSLTDTPAAPVWGEIGGGTTQAQKNMIARSIFNKKFSLRK